MKCEKKRVNKRKIKIIMGGNYMELSIQIKKYRTELHLSQEELAEKVYVTRQTISNWENEKSYPDIHAYYFLVHCLMYLSIN